MCKDKQRLIISPNIITELPKRFDHFGETFEPISNSTQDDNVSSIRRQPLLR